MVVRPRCFLSTPMSGEFQQVRKAIVEALRKADVDPVLLETVPSFQGSVAEVIQDEIRKADFVVADVSKGTPSVIYEVGFAHAMQKPVLLIAQNLDSVPAPFKTSYLLFIYDPADLDRLQTAVVSWSNRYAPAYSQ
jgi:hypothetical protein